MDTERNLLFAVLALRGEFISREQFAEACAFHAWELRAGMVFGAALLARPDLAFVFSPIVVPLLAAPAVSILTSRPAVGAWFRGLGFMLTPEELGAPAIAVRRGRRPLRRPFTPITVSFNPAPEDEPGLAMHDLTLVAARAPHEMAEQHA